MTTDSKTCEWCGEVFSRRELRAKGRWYTDKGWQQRKYCSHDCWNQVQREQEKIKKEAQSKRCVLCGNEFHNTLHNSPAEWQKRKYCSQQCARHAKKPRKRKHYSQDPGTLTDRQRARIAAEKLFVALPEYHRLSGAKRKELIDRMTLDVR